MKTGVDLSDSELRELYWSRRLSTHKIAKLKGLTFSKVIHLMKKYGIERRSRVEAVVEAVAKRVHLDPSPTLAYVLGVCYGDGSVWGWRKDEYRVGLGVQSKTFAESFYETLKKLEFKPRLYYHQGRYRVVASSKIFHDWFKSLDFDYLKSLFEENDLAKAFVRGFYESEGWHCLTKRGEGDKLRRVLGLGCSNRRLIKLTQHWLRLKGIEFPLEKHRPKRKGLRWVYCLQTSAKEKIDEFLSLVDPVIKREPSYRTHHRSHRAGPSVNKSSIEFWPRSIVDELEEEKG